MRIIRMATSGLAVRSFILPELDMLKKEGHEIIVISDKEDALALLLKERKIQYYPLPLKRNISLFHDLFSLIRLFIFFIRKRPDIVHTITPKAGLLGMSAAWLARVPRRVHDYVGMVQETRSGISRRILDITDKICCRSATIVFANSQSLKVKMLEHHIISEQKINLIHKGSSYGVDTIFFSRENIDSYQLMMAKENIKYDASLQYLLFAGRLVRDKGIEELVKCFVELTADFPAIRLLLIGDFEPHLDAIAPHIQDKIENHPQIIFVPWTDKIRAYLHLATMLIHPTYREGFANILLEAGAMRCPIICSDATGNIDLIRDGENGLLFPVADKEKLKEKLKWALDHSVNMKQLADSLYKDVQHDYTKEMIIKMNLEKYK